MNRGEIRSTVGAGGPRTLDVALDNRGLLTVDQSLALRQSGVTSHLTSGTVAIAGGQTLSVQNGTLAIDGGALTGTGTLDLAGGITMQLNVPLDPRRRRPAARSQRQRDHRRAGDADQPLDPGDGQRHHQRAAGERGIPAHPPASAS